MDIGTIAVLLILAVVVIVLAFLFRDRIKLALKAPGFGLDFEGRNRVQDAARPGEGDPARSAASAAEGTPSQRAGDRSIQVARDAQGTFVTGDNNRVAQVRGDRNRFDQTGKD